MARDPVSGEWRTFQVKSVHIRGDRANQLVVFAKKGNGTAYAKSDADYIVGVLDTEAGPRAWMFENRGQSEYWASSETRADQRWIALPNAIDREMIEGGDVTCPV